MKKVIGFKTQCILCGLTLSGVDEVVLKEDLSKHIDNTCPAAEKLREWDRQSIFSEMMDILGFQVARDSLRALVRKHGLKLIKEALVSLEEESE